METMMYRAQKTKKKIVFAFFSFIYIYSVLAIDCTCGFDVKRPNGGGDAWLFTDAVETDFTKLKSITLAKDWKPLEFNVSAEAGRGTYSKIFTPKNIAFGPNFADKGTSEQRDGVKLSVGATIVNGGVPVAEMDTMRQDILWGSFRAGMKLTAVKGTCSAFFWYFNDTQEIDMEFLSMEYNRENGTYPVNLVIQSKESAERGFDASYTPMFKIVNLGFDPTIDFHEYRFDYLPRKVYFYADSKLLAEMEGPEIPDHAGHLILQHWSNGNTKWSGGPPKEDATMTVSYVNAYFNSSDARKQDKWKASCGLGRGSACLVPSSTFGDVANGGQFLGPNHTLNTGDESLATTKTVTIGSILLLLIGPFLTV